MTTIEPNGEKKSYDGEIEAKENTGTVSQFKADAVEAETAEYNMTVMEAVKAYPMACFWAFVMSSTIVSCLLSLLREAAADSC